MNSKNYHLNNNLNKIHIVKNKEIIIYTNGEESNRYHYSEIVEIPSKESETAISHIKKKYSNFEVENRHTKLDQNKKEKDFFEEEDKTDPKLKEFFKDVEDEDWSNEGGIETVTENKKYKKGIKTIEEKKFPIKNNYNGKNYLNKNNNNIKEEYVQINEREQSDDEEESEELPQYIIEVESYTSPTFRNVEEKKAEDFVLNGINCSQMVNGIEKVGIIFLGEEQKLIFVCFEDKKETIIDLNYIKRIYFNIRGSVNLRNYIMKNNNEKFIQFVQINNIKLDFKFKNEDDLELLIKGLYVAYKNRTPIINKEIIYKKIEKYFKAASSNKKPENKNITKYNNNNGYKYHHQQHLINESNHYIKNNINYKEEEYEEEEEMEDNINNENDNIASNKKEEDDGILTTTVTEVFKNGKLINEETKQEYGGRITKLNSYSPDINEYQEYLRKSKLKNSDNNINENVEE